MVSEELREALLNQWVEEKLNANIYTHFGAWLKNKGLNNLGQFFINNSKEEDGHAAQIVKLMTDLNIDFVSGHVPFFDALGSEDFGCNKIAELFLLRETQTTESLNEIKKIAIEQDASIIEEFMRKMIKQQRHELEEANDFYDKFMIMNQDMKAILLWDLSLEDD